MCKNILIGLFVLFFSFPVNAAENYNLYYFYNNTRCATCTKFEKMAKEIASELPVKFQAINVQDKGNEHYMKDYKLYTKSIIIADEKGNYKNLDKIWVYGTFEPMFKQYVKDEVNKFIKDK